MKNLSCHFKENLNSSENGFQNYEKNTRNESEVASWSERDKQLAYTEISMLGIIFMAAMVVNVMIILVLWNRRKNLSRMYVFMLHLSLADLFVAFFQVLPQLMWDITDVFIGPDPLCRIIKFLQLVGMFASMYMIVAMTVDRFQAICYPIVIYQKRRALWNTAVCTSCAISFIFSIPQAFIFSKTEIAPGIFECWALFTEPWGLKAYVTWIGIAIFFFPVAILIACQIRICKTIKNNVCMKQRKEFVKSCPLKAVLNQARNTGSISKARIKTVRMTVVTVASYILCWAPFFIVQMWAAWSTAPPKGALFTILMLLGNLNSCVNPWIYTRMYFCGHISSCKKQLTYFTQYISSHGEFVITSYFNVRTKELDVRGTIVKRWNFNRASYTFAIQRMTDTCRRQKCYFRRRGYIMKEGPKWS
uniref:G-protein coupled receptors family 1 profile domain-containing protein n=2 Tax=Pyxicephalus adspersus TaxID=30357 RepID=A0AAV3B2S3_PYXAD|nr:TPA: hypothetical protein GDO54_007085 [Pyxicephalus adspersus]